MTNALGRFPRGLITIFGLILTCVTLCGCGQRDDAPTISGTVTVDGQPAEGLYVVFHDAQENNSDSVASSTRTASGGKFVWTVPKPGNYIVTAFWPEKIVTQEETIEGADRLSGKYRDLKSPAATVSITAGENQLDEIELSR